MELTVSTFRFGVGIRLESRLVRLNIRLGPLVRLKGWAVGASPTVLGWWRYEKFANDDLRGVQVKVAGSDEGLSPPITVYGDVISATQSSENPVRDD